MKRWNCIRKLNKGPPKLSLKQLVSCRTYVSCILILKTTKNLALISTALPNSRKIRMNLTDLARFFFFLSKKMSEFAKQKKEKTDPKLLWTSSNRYYPKLLKELQEILPPASEAALRTRRASLFEVSITLRSRKASFRSKADFFSFF